MDKTFLRITDPSKERGIATLRIGSEMWNYLPNTDKVIKVPPSMMMGSWMGSDFSNDDLVHEFTFLDDYEFEWVTPESARADLYYIRLVPKASRPIVWGEVITAARRSDLVPVWEKFYDEKGKLMRVIRFTDVRDFGGRRVPSTMELTPMTEEGHRTVIRFLELQFDANVSSDVFTLRNLRSTVH